VLRKKKFDFSYFEKEKRLYSLAKKRGGKVFRGGENKRGTLVWSTQEKKKSPALTLRKKKKTQNLKSAKREKSREKGKRRGDHLLREGGPNPY